MDSPFHPASDAGVLHGCKQLTALPPELAGCVSLAQTGLGSLGLAWVARVGAADAQGTRTCPPSASPCECTRYVVVVSITVVVCIASAALLPAFVFFLRSF